MGQPVNLGSVERNGDQGWRVRILVCNANTRGPTRPSEAEAYADLNRAKQCLSREAMIAYIASLTGAKATGPLERHPTDEEAAAVGTQETVTASPLLLAIGDEDTGEVRRLCHGRADLNAEDEVDCFTPLFFASFRGHVAMASLLCSAKADVHASVQGATRISGQTPLIVASIRGHTEVVQFLCNAGVHKDQGDVAGRAALFEAACAGHSSVVGHLLQTRAEIGKARHVDCMTPLHGACFSGHAAVVRCLCSAGADKFRQSSAARN